MELRNVSALMSRGEWLLISGSFAISAVAAILTALNANAVLIFVISGGSLALLAAFVRTTPPPARICPIF